MPLKPVLILTLVLSMFPCSGIVEAQVSGAEGERLRVYPTPLAQTTSCASASPPLMCAAHTGGLESAKRLIEDGANVNASSRDGWTALMSAADKGHLEIVKLLVAHGAKIDARYYNSATALMWAAGSGHAAVVKFLIDNGADINSQEQGGSWIGALGGCDDTLVGRCWYHTSMRTPLIFATQSGHVEVVKLLLEKGADFSLRDAKGMTALMHAAHYDNFDIVKLLLASRADVNVSAENGRTALMLALAPLRSENPVNMVRALLRHGADVNASDRNGRTALSMAQDSGLTELVQLLKERGAK
jgi:ankyrin repeat protein